MTLIAVPVSVHGMGAAQGKLLVTDRYDIGGGSFTKAKTKRPLLVLVIIIIVGIPAGLAVFAGLYSLTRFALGSPPLDPGLPTDIFVPMTVLSMVVGVVLFLGLNAIWERRYGGRPLALATMLFGLVTSLATQFLVPSDRIAVGVSWIATIVTAVSFGLLFFPEVIQYFGSRS